MLKRHHTNVSQIMIMVGYVYPFAHKAEDREGFMKRLYEVNRTIDTCCVLRIFFFYKNNRLVISFFTFSTRQHLLTRSLLRFEPYNAREVQLLTLPYGAIFYCLYKDMLAISLHSIVVIWLHELHPQIHYVTKPRCQTL